MSNPVFWENIRKNIINLSSAENAQRVVKVNPQNILNYFFLFFSENRIRHFMQMSNPVFWEKIRKNIINLSSAENAQRVIKVNPQNPFHDINTYHAMGRFSR